MQNTPNMEELQSRFTDMESTYKDLLASANTTIANLAVILKATQRELLKATTESLELKKKLDTQSAANSYATEDVSSDTDLKTNGVNGGEHHAH